MKQTPAGWRNAKTPAVSTFKEKESITVPESKTDKNKSSWREPKNTRTTETYQQLRLDDSLGVKSLKSCAFV